MNINKIVEEFDNEFSIGLLDKFHNRLYFEINDRINSLEPKKSKIEEVEKETIERIRNFLIQQLTNQKKEIREEVEKLKKEEGQTEKCKDVLDMNYLIGKNKGYNQAIQEILNLKSLEL